MLPVLHILDKDFLEKKIYDFYVSLQFRNLEMNLWKCKRVLNDKAIQNLKNYESVPHIPPELWCSPSAILNNDCTVIMIALNSTTPPMEKAIYEFL